MKKSFSSELLELLDMWSKEETKGEQEILSSEEELSVGTRAVASFGLHKLLVTNCHDYYDQEESRQKDGTTVIRAIKPIGTFPKDSDAFSIWFRRLKEFGTWR